MSQFELLKYRSFRFDANSNKIELEISDTEYLSYLKEYNGGYYFNNSLHLYGMSTKDDWNNIEIINKLFQSLYNSVTSKIFCFGEDIFGNQFAFDSGSIIMFNIETGEKETLSDSFNNWLSILFSDLNYLTGFDLTNSMESNFIEDLKNGFRFCPKYPFITGGEYSLENLYLKNYKENLEFNSSIAKQVYILEDGQQVILSVNNKDDIVKRT